MPATEQERDSRKISLDPSEISQDQMNTSVFEHHLFIVGFMHTREPLHTIHGKETEDYKYMPGIICLHSNSLLNTKLRAEISFVHAAKIKDERVSLERALISTLQKLSRIMNRGLSQTC